MRSLLFSFQACDVTLKGPFGTVTSPGYPAKYPNNKTCHTTITAPKGKIIILNFSTFQLEHSLTCYFDYVELIDGKRSKKYCGNTVPPEYRSKGNSLVVKFYSDTWMNDKGFRASFTVEGK